ncbi:Inosine/uridine-preferring nucleoside hydrolase [Coriobacterium glomerans PW2]|uniref:Inosine/uridine-preferring nucleoside hydrolase n=1 Tax=Coriobacterium glomerans (strain ATCC 49209 / DSM 20642 / JCM 10262 / PW2) TaxID=700015 RepID=F2NAN6_CORGP|nr:nucleoside hydrolase [Coriobacterium glomerans]AEB07492.1 Inosine/uridine-preferring nucleoside hydrolase [Coriobacterium glomerans PW2]
MSKKIILDLDTGIDDTLALAYVLASPEAELIGITGTYGNVTVAQGVQNDLDLLELFGYPDIPVYAGPTHPLASDSFEVLDSSGEFHGKNGTGDVEIPAKAAGSVQEQNAVDFIIESVRQYGDELVIVPTGASTTMAAVLRKAPDIENKIHIVMMGGALTQPGNSTIFAEANVLQDPEATKELFSSSADITMIGLDVTTKVRMSRQDNEQLRATGTRIGTFMADMIDFYIEVSERYDSIPGCNLHDPLAAAVALDSSLVTTFPINLTVDLEDGRGRTIGDPARLLDAPNTKVALAVDGEHFVPGFLSRLMWLAISA